MNRLNRQIKHQTDELVTLAFEEKLSSISHKNNSLYHLGRSLKRKKQQIPPLTLNDEHAFSDEKKCEFLARNFFKAH
jgi:hypothetical protein